MATNVNVFFSNFRLGTNVTTQRRFLDVTVNWTDANGTPQTRIETVTFPDVLAQIPTEFRDDLLREIIVRLLRSKAGINE